MDKKENQGIVCGHEIFKKQARKEYV